MQEIDKIITELQDNIILSKLDVLHPSLLTHEEISKYNIDYEKVKRMKVGFSKTTTNKLIFLIKIPYNMIKIYKKLILPLKNTDTCNTINLRITPLLEIQNNFYEYTEDKALSQLNKLNHGIMYKNCEIIKNCNKFTP